MHAYGPCVQVTQILRLPREAALQVLRNADCTLFERPLLVRSVCDPFRYDGCAARDLRRILHPAFLNAAPDALRPLAVESIEPESSRCWCLHFPHMKDCYCASAVAAAPTIPHLTSLNLNLYLTCCSFEDRDTASRMNTLSPSHPSRLELPASLESLRINCAVCHGPSRSGFVSLTVVLQALLAAMPSSSI